MPLSNTFFIVWLLSSHSDAFHKLMKSEIFGCPYKCQGGGTSGDVTSKWVDFTQKSVKVGPILTPSQKNPETWVIWVESWVKIMQNFWKMGIKSEQKLGKSFNKHGFPFSWQCVRVLWRSWSHIVKLNEWTSVTAIVNFCPITCRLCYMSTDALNRCGMGPLLVLVSPCFRENVVVTCKIGSF